MSEGTPPPPDNSADDSADNSAGDGPGQTPPPPPPGEQPPSGDQPPGWGTPYPPPPGQPGGYGAAPPPPPGGGYGPGYGAERPYSAPDAIGYGWNKFKANPAPLLLGALILMVVSAVLSGVTNTISGGMGATGSRFLTNALLSLIVGLVSQLLVAGLVKGALDTADGRAVSVGGMFEGWDKGKVVIAALLVSILTWIGIVLCIIPGLIVGFLLSYTIFFVVDRDMAPIDAMKASYSFVTGNLGPTLVYYLLAILVVIIGAILCLVGLLVAIPIAVVGAAYTYRTLHGQPVIPA